jgi:nitroreductase
MADKTLYDSLLEVAKKRHTIRRFKPDSIPDEYIDKIIEVARWAPSGCHFQPWEFVVIRKKEVKDKIIEALVQITPPLRRDGKRGISQDSGQGDFRNAPVFILLLGDRRTKAGLPDEIQKSNRIVDEVFCSSLSNAFFSLHLAATALGLASQWYSSSASEKAEKALRDNIGFPEHLRIFDMMVLGYAAHTPINKEPRSLKDMVHYDNCGITDFRTDEKVIGDAYKSSAWCAESR